MSHFQQLSIHHLLAKKLALTSIMVISLLLGGCTGDSLDAVTTNADGSVNLSAQDTAQAKAETGLSALPTLYMIELKWDAPTTKSSGTPLSQSEIKEYRIVFFQEGVGTKTSVSVDNATTRVGIPLGSKGTYHFEITTVDIGDRESDPKLVTASL